MMPRLWALSLLAWALLKTMLSWPLRRSRSLRSFENNYAPEGLLPVSARVHQALARPGACIACGRCDRVSRAGTVPLSQLVRAWSRSLPDAPLAATEFARYSDRELGEAERLCPARVPIVQLATLAREQTANMNAALP